ncbi:hypothetical protein V3O24_04450 [Methylobacter sp. Wu8]|uniref:hypothetical protein n=1 Tax=Methylobacter sp. Wu8 TaxID=3118457 RepID=UPI002F2CB719
MITPQEAEKLAAETIKNYMNACQLQTTQDAGNALMKLVSMAGLAMCATVGQKEAVDRLQGTAAYIAQPKYSGPWKQEREH